MNQYDLKDKVVVITGGAGFLGKNYAKAILDAHGGVVIIDINKKRLKEAAEEIRSIYGSDLFLAIPVDITNQKKIEAALASILKKFSRLDVLINNAANNPKMIDSNTNRYRLENFSNDMWEADLRVGLTGAYLCCKVFGKYMIAKRCGKIINISSDLGIIGPDQRLYEIDGIADSNQPVKPVSYSVVKTGLIGLTNYIATTWGKYNVTSNALILGGVQNGQSKTLISKISDRVPLGRMAHPTEYCASVVYLCSDATSYMNGASIVIDGGRTKW